MVYKDEVLPYKRVVNEKMPVKKKRFKFLTVHNVLFYLSAFFAARVLMLDEFMPFGVAFFIAACGVLEKEAAIITGVVAIGGYLSTLFVYMGSFKGYLSLMHVLVVVTIILIQLILNNKDKNRIFKISAYAFIINALINALFRAKFISMDFSYYDSMLAVAESVILVASSYIFSYGLPLYFEYKKRKILSREEMICMGLMLAIVVSGTWDIRYADFSLKNILGFFIVVVMGYTEGPAMGAASGAAVGLISSMSDNGMPVVLGIFAFCGLVSGIFKDLGKLVTGASFIISAALLGFYTNRLMSTGTDIILFNALAASLLFVLIPSGKYEKFTLLVDGDKRAVELQKSYVERVKDLLGLKLSGIYNTLSGLSDILEKSIENELSNKLEINGMIEKLADRVCIQCDSRGLCWTREMYYTYDSFMEILRQIERKGSLISADLPESLKKKCLRPNELLKQANYIFEIFRLNNRWKKKFINSRLIVSEQVKGISELIQSMIEDASVSMEFKNDIEEEIAVALDKKGIEFDDVLAVKNNRDRYEVTVYRKPCAGQQLCTKDFVSLISKTLGVRMIRESTQCKINRECSMCHFRLTESVEYNISTAFARLSKEEISGDSYSFGEVGQGRYMIALSDGMGSGVRAANESNTTISLLEKFLEAGYEKNAAIKATNSVLVFRSLNEGFSTIDMALIDLYSGVGEFVKIGAASTFIKSGMEINVLKNTNLPAGILDEVEIESDIVQLKNGDMIVMVTDGVIDANSELKGKWILKALNEIDSVNPKDVADYIIKKGKEHYGEHIGDDMTVVVSKVWRLM